MHPIDMLADPILWIIFAMFIPGATHMFWTIRSDEALKQYILKRRNRNVWRGVR